MRHQTCLAHLARDVAYAVEVSKDPVPRGLTLALQAKISRARDQLLVFLAHPGRVAVTNTACQRALRPTVVQRKVTNGDRALWAAEGEADVRTVVDTARLSGADTFGTILKTIGA